jgi:hypothetical protein
LIIISCEHVNIASATYFSASSVLEFSKISLRGAFLLTEVQPVIKRSNLGSTGQLAPPLFMPSRPLFSFFFALSTRLKGTIDTPTSSSS